MAKKILIVDDSATVRQQVSTVLEQAGFAVTQATDGQNGAETIEADQEISLVICDVNMPRMNGLDMLARVKDGGLRPSLPVVMLTTEVDPSLIQRAKSLGAKGWIVKPFQADQLLAAVNKLAV